ncbi:hypothetical protein MACJ_000411 [Theileria orientalis]|uniref:Uncharacterized protein n=1 Tax=Theileria orientalis TaxID=68886 RepID=A0A976QQG0_THEOR|nr:hypothetical protein MACJ_000411 [Theileria orientalis]
MGNTFSHIDLSDGKGDYTKEYCRVNVKVEDYSDSKFEKRIQSIKYIYSYSYSYAKYFNLVVSVTALGSKSFYYYVSSENDIIDVIEAYYSKLHKDLPLILGFKTRRSNIFRYYFFVNLKAAHNLKGLPYFPSTKFQLTKELNDEHNRRNKLKFVYENNKSDEYKSKRFNWDGLDLVYYEYLVDDDWLGPYILSTDKVFEHEKSSIVDTSFLRKFNGNLFDYVKVYYTDTKKGPIALLVTFEEESKKHHYVRTDVDGLYWTERTYQYDYSDELERFLKSIKDEFLQNINYQLERNVSYAMGKIIVNKYTKSVGYTEYKHKPDMRGDTKANVLYKMKNMHIVTNNNVKNNEKAPGLSNQRFTEISTYVLNNDHNEHLLIKLTVEFNKTYYLHRFNKDGTKWKQITLEDLEEMGVLNQEQLKLKKQKLEKQGLGKTLDEMLSYERSQETTKTLLQDISANINSFIVVLDNKSRYGAHDIQKIVGKSDSEKEIPPIDIMSNTVNIDYQGDSETIGHCDKIEGYSVLMHDISKPGEGSKHKAKPLPLYIRLYLGNNKVNLYDNKDKPQTYLTYSSQANELYVYFCKSLSTVLLFFYNGKAYMPKTKNGNEWLLVTEVVNCSESNKQTIKEKLDKIKKTFCPDELVKTVTTRGPATTPRTTSTSHSEGNRPSRPPSTPIRRPDTSPGQPGTPSRSAGTTSQTTVTRSRLPETSSIPPSGSPRGTGTTHRDTGRGFGKGVRTDLGSDRGQDVRPGSHSEGHREVDRNKSSLKPTETRPGGESSAKKTLEHESDKTRIQTQNHFSEPGVVILKDVEFNIVGESSDGVMEQQIQSNVDSKSGGGSTNITVIGGSVGGGVAGVGLENNAVNKKFTLKVGSGVNNHILTINDVVSGANADYVLFKKIIFIPKRDTTKSGKDNTPENIPVLIEFYDDCKKIQFCKKDKDWFYWERKEVNYDSSIKLESELKRLKEYSDSYDVLTYELDKKNSYSNIGVTLDTDSTSHYSVYSHTPTDLELNNKKTKILIKNQEIKIETGEKYEKKLFDLSTYFLINNTGTEDVTFFLIKFIESDEEGYVGTPSYYTKTKDSDEKWTHLDILFPEMQERLRKILELEFYGSNFENMRNDSYNLLNDKEPTTFRKRSSVSSVSHKNVRVITIDKGGRPMVQISPHDINIKETRYSGKQSHSSRDHHKRPKCVTISHIPADRQKDHLNLSKVIVLLLEKQCSYGDNDVNMALKQSSLDPQKCRILNQTTVVTGISSEGTRRCINKLGFHLIEHYFINLDESIKKGKDSIELKIFIRDSYSSHNFSELKLYKSDSDTIPIKLYYKPSRDDFYVYFYGNDPRPLLFFYDDYTYRPNSIFDYYQNWIHVPNITDFSCDKDKNTKLLDTLSEIVGLLNVVHLEQSRLFTYGGVHTDDGTENSLYYAVHEFEDKHIIIKVSFNKTPSYFICSHFPYGIDGDGEGFRLGLISYDGTTNSLATYDLKRRLVSVFAYYSLTDKELERPLMLQLGFKPEIIEPELSYQDYLTELDPEDYKLIPDIQSYLGQQFPPLHHPTSQLPDGPLSQHPQVEIFKPFEPHSTDTTYTSGAKGTHPKVAKPGLDTPKSKPPDTHSQSRPTHTTQSKPSDIPSPPKPDQATKDPTSLSPGKSVHPVPPIQPVPPFPPVQQLSPAHTQLFSDPTIVHEFHKLDSTQNDRWIKTEDFDQSNIEKSLNRIESELKTKLEYQKQSESRAKGGGEPIDITLIGGSVGGGVAGVGLVGGGAAVLLKFPYILVPSIKPLL